MSNFASNLASLARLKLHSGSSNGSRDNLSLHRWVLLKNSIIRDDAAPLTPAEEERDSGAPSLVPDAPDAEDDEDDDALNYDGAFFNFLFPDPGYGAEAQRDAATIATEEQWFDSLLETLGDDEDDDSNQHHIPSAVKLIASTPPEADDVYHSNAHPPQPSDPASPASSYSDEYSLASPPPLPLQSIAVPYPVPYPPLVKPYGAAPAAHDDDANEEDELCYYAPRARPATPVAAASTAAYFLPYNDLEDSYLSMPDAMEDSALSDDDTEPLPATPWSRSRSSFSYSVSDVAAGVLDPASVPLPLEHEQHHHHRARGHPSLGAEPRIYSSSAADDVFAFDPNPGMASVDAAPVYSPFFFQNC